MLEERLNKIIRSIELQKFSGTGPGSELKGADELNISLTELMIQATVFSDKFPEEVKLFAEALSGELQKISTPGLPPQERTNIEIAAAELLESNKNSISYLNSLNRLLILTDYGQSDPEQLNKSFDISLEPGLSFRNDYIEKLAEAYVRGNDSNSIQYLLKTNNSVFHESLGFIENVKTAIVLTEREQLKKKMQLLDELETFDLSESAVKAAVALSERERLKEEMMKIDREHESKLRHFPVERSLPAAKDPTGSEGIPSLEENRFNWKRYAVAASVIGLIAITSVLVFNNKNSFSDIAGDKPLPPDSGRNAPGWLEEKNNALANNLIDTTETVLAVRKEEAMGFAAKQEKVTVRVYRITAKIPVTPALQKEADSLNRLNKMYSFKDNNLSFYTTNVDLPVVYKIDTRYYLKMTDSLYQFLPAHKLTRLTRVNDKNISDRIDKINYQQDNK